MDEIAIGSLAEISAGDAAPQESDAFGSEGVPFVRAGSLPKLLAGQTEEELELVDPAAAARHKLRTFPPGTILFAKSGMSATKGHVYSLRSHAHVVSHLATINCRDPGDARFVEHALRAFPPTRLINDPAYPSIRLGDINAMRLPVPADPKDRTRIADILDRADDLRAKRQAALDKLDSLTQAIFHDMFGDLRLNMRGWPEVGISELCELVVDCAHKTAPTVEYGTPYRMIRTTNVRKGEIDLTRSRYVTQQTFDEWNTQAVPQIGDVILTREAPVGAAGILRTEAHVFLGQRLVLYRIDPEKSTPEYLLSLFQSGALVPQFDRHGSGSTVKHLNVPICKSFIVPSPPLALQEEFSRRSVEARNLVVTAGAGLGTSTKLVASLQQRAFSGAL